MMEHLLDKIYSWFDDPENLKNWEETLKRDIERMERYRDKLSLLSKEQRSEFIRKCKNKYESEEYKDREYKKGFEPRCRLYDIILDYARMFGEEIEEDEDFLSEKYIIDDTWAIELYQGQGSFVRIYDITQ